MPTAPPNRSSENLSLLLRYQAGDAAAAEALLAANEPLVVKIAGKYAWRASSLEFDDLLQEGRLGLLRACRGFDASRGLEFSTYAYHWIRQAIGRAVEGDQLIHIPSHALRRDDLPECCVSLHAPAVEDGEPLGDLLPAPDDTEGEALAAVWRAEAMAQLTERERRVLEHRAAGASLREAGAIAGIGREGARHLERRALARLRDYLETA